jgi:hypothetical protein
MRCVGQTTYMEIQEMHAKLVRKLHLKDNKKEDGFRETGCDGVARIQVDKDRVNGEHGTESSGSLKAVSFLISRVTVTFPRMILFHGVS